MKITRILGLMLIILAISLFFGRAMFAFSFLLSSTILFVPEVINSDIQNKSKLIIVITIILTGIITIVLFDSKTRLTTHMLLAAVSLVAFVLKNCIKTKRA